MAANVSITRRAVVRSFAAILGAGLAHGLPGPAAAATCPNACRSMIGEDDGWIRGLPIIDAHCHIFNGRDIPAAHFINKVFLPDYAPHLKPASRRRLEQEIGEFVTSSLRRTPGYEQERSVLEAKLAGEAADTASSGVYELPKFARGSARACYGADVADNITAVRNLVAILDDFRHKNFEALVATNTQTMPGVEVALFTPAMVDMDYWLGTGGEAEASVADIGTDGFSLRQATPAQQVELMEMIQRLHAGRCHGFVSFCPWRQVDDLHHNALVGEESARRRQTALETVRDAILKRGFVGVKLYPPMGFLPLGNAELPLEAFPPAAAAAPYAASFGRLLDEALLGLYEFCVAHDVPVMAHTAPSNGAGVFESPVNRDISNLDNLLPDMLKLKVFEGSDSRKTGYEERAHPDGWRRVLAQPGLSGLKLNLAHFGGSRDVAKSAQWRAAIGELMDAYPSVYTDLSHYPEMLMDNFIGTGQHCREAAEFLEPLRKEFLAGERGAKRVRRMLYGSDWSMLSKEYYYADYLPVVAHMYRRKIHGVGQGAKANARAFLSANAAAFLGLRPGDRARARLEAWYAAHGLDPAPLNRFDAVGE